MLSIVIPFYNGEKWLPILLQSLDNSISKTAHDFALEIIIIIDSEATLSTTIEQFVTQHLQSANIRYVIIKNTSNLGVARSRDIGLSHATGEYITFIDQDDYVNTNYCSILNSSLRSGADLYLLNGIIRNTLENKEILVYYHMYRPSLKQLIYGNNILSPSFWIARTKFLKDNKIHFSLPFDNFRGIDDWYYSLQIFLHKPLKLELIPQPLIYYCIHDANFSHNLQMQFDGSIAVLEHLYEQVSDLQKKWILKRIKTFQFSKLFYLQSKKQAILQHPIIFLHFLYHYLYDTNRLIRFAHRTVIGMKIR